MTDTQQEQPPEMNDERFEQLRNDPRVIIHRRKATRPFKPFLRVNPGIDILELIARRDPKDEPGTPHMDGPIGSEAVRAFLAQHHCIQCVRSGNHRVRIVQSIPNIFDLYRWVNGQPSSGREIYNDIHTALNLLEKQGWLDDKHRWSRCSASWDHPLLRNSDDAVVVTLHCPGAATSLPAVHHPLWTSDIVEIPVKLDSLAELLRKERDDGCHDKTVPGGLINLTDRYRGGQLSGDPLPLKITMRLRAYGSTPILTRPQVIEELLKLLRDEPLGEGDGDWLSESFQSSPLIQEGLNKFSIKRFFGGGMRDALTVRELRTMPYRRYLQSGHWRSVRGAALVRAGWRCQRCSSHTSLEVHHHTYKRRGREHADDVIVLCADCHSRFHKRMGWTPFADRYFSSRRGVKDLGKAIAWWTLLIAVILVAYYVTRH